MKLSEALNPAFEKNASIRRKSWGKAYLALVHDNVLSILMESGEFLPWTITITDIRADDWEVVEEN